MKINILSHPAYLFEGPPEELTEHLQNALKSVWCSQSEKGSCFCAQCRMIVNQQHTNILWLDPSTDYTTEGISIVFEKIRFSLNVNEHFFFVFPHSHLLSSTCGNKMLKIIEEPPHGYHFLFLTNNIHAVLKTIVSRCVVERHGASFSRSHPLVDFLSTPAWLNDPQLFEQEIKKYSLTHLQLQEILYDLLSTAQQHVLSRQANHSSYWQNIATILTQRLKKPPQSGSTAIFLKLLYLDLHQKHAHEKNNL